MSKYTVEFAASLDFNGKIHVVDSEVVCDTPEDALATAQSAQEQWGMVYSISHGCMTIWSRATCSLEEFIEKVNKAH